MFDENEEPYEHPGLSKNLDPLSADELHDYIEDLQTEIARVEGEIEKKKGFLNAADDVFKS